MEKNVKDNTQIITCPHCHEEFSLDNAGYANIEKQIRDKIFEKELKIRIEAAQKDQKQALIEVENKFNLEIEKLKAEKKSTEQQAKSTRDLALAEQKVMLEKQISQLQNSLKEESEKITSLQEQAQEQKKTALAEQKNQITEELHKRDTQIMQLNNDLERQQEIVLSFAKTAEAEKKAALAEQKNQITEELHKRDAEIQKLTNNLQQQAQSSENQVMILQTQQEQKLSEITKSLEIKIKDREEEIERIKNMRAQLSTKMIGETLELHCERVFNQLRSAAFPYAYFEKDNNIVDGTKGDYIFRDYDNKDDKNNNKELLSIMFEMKNESEDTLSKHKNEDFFKKLDKDRRKKGCEYAVLVSLLEADNELYNDGIYEVYQYDKMYVIRPQFFLTIISLLKKGALQALEPKRELEKVRLENIDVTNFENKLIKFQTGFGKNCDSASNNFENAIEDIDKAIKSLNNTKTHLLTTMNQLRLANNKAQDLSIKKLTYNNPTMKKKFDDAQ